MHDDAYIGERSENNIKYVVHDDLGWKNQTTRYILPRDWLYECFSQFHRCGTYSVLSRSSSIDLCACSWYIKKDESTVLVITHSNATGKIWKVNLAHPVSPTTQHQHYWNALQEINEYCPSLISVIIYSADASPTVSNLSTIRLEMHLSQRLAGITSVTIMSRILLKLSLTL